MCLAAQACMNLCVDAGYLHAPFLRCGMVGCTHLWAGLIGCLPVQT